MQKIFLPERPDWRDLAREVGFNFAAMHGEPYWDESSAYRFSLRQIEEDIEAPATELHAMCCDAAATIADSDRLMHRLGVPERMRDLVARSLKDNHPAIYGRFDLSYDGTGPAKLLEYNADTATSLYESASFQWAWLEDQTKAGVLPDGSDQFNGIHEALVERFRDLFPAGTDIHFTAAGGNDEDYGTVECMGWAARAADLGAHYVDLEKIGISDGGQFLDDEDRVIGTLFKLYAWEDLFEDDYANHIAGSSCLFLEPPWKALLSNKGLLPILWEMHEGHPNLLPAFFHDDVDAALSGRGSAAPDNADAFDRAHDVLARGYVTKPIFSREGASVRIFEGGEETEASPDGSYGAHPRIVQAYAPLPQHDGFHPVIGAWIVGDACVGMGIRDDQTRITRDLSRFKPHFIEPE